MIRDEESQVERACARLKDFLESLDDEGITQQQVAYRANVPPQYLSDIKQGRRPLTELVARRIGEEFGIDYRWLLGQTDSKGGSLGSLGLAPDVAGQGAVPLFPDPIEGEPRLHPKWDGAVAELSGMAAAQAAVAESPYVLCFRAHDREGRLRKGDFILISQAPSADAETSVVRHRKKLFLARKGKGGSWVRVAKVPHPQMPSDCPVVGHCVGIVWGSLMP